MIYLPPSVGVRVGWLGPRKPPRYVERMLGPEATSFELTTRGGISMPTVRAGDINVYYETTGSGEPLLLIPYLAADQACYAFQVPEYAKHFTCISVDLRGAGQSDKPDMPYSTELFADDVAAFMQAIGVERA